MKVINLSKFLAQKQPYTCTLFNNILNQIWHPFCPSSFKAIVLYKSKYYFDLIMVTIIIQLVLL